MSSPKVRKSKASRSEATCHSTAKRQALHVDAAARTKNLARLARIEGQVRGIQRMVEEDRYCADILVQVRAVERALQAVSLELLQNHLRHCARAAFEEGGDRAEAMGQELLDLLRRHGR